MSTQHTPGPWAISKLASPQYCPQFGIYAEGEPTDLAIVKNDDAEANARLIAAAPDLLHACKWALDSMLAIDGMTKDMAIKTKMASPAHHLRTAIAKANAK